LFGLWSHDDIIERCLGSLRAHADALDREQAVRGLDACCEVDLHAILARAADLRVWREQGYPSDILNDTSLALPRDRRRCDLVLGPPNALALEDPLDRARDAAEQADSLFAASLPDLQTPTTTLCPEDAYWLEVKLTGQWVLGEGEARPNPAYAADLGSAGSDLPKLAGDPRIHACGLLLILFSADEATARHDLALAAHRWLDLGYPVRSPMIRSFPIQDRIGNARCTLCLTPPR